jgi:integrase
MTGIQVRHARTCRSNEEGSCNCKPSYRAWVYDKRSKQKIRKTFSNQAEAKTWRNDAASLVSKKKLRPPSKTTLHEAAETWLRNAEAGTVLNRNMELYKPSVLRSYAQGLRDHVLPELGALRLDEIERQDLQALANRLRTTGLDPSTVRNAIAPVRCIYREAEDRQEIAVNPTSGLKLQAPKGRRVGRATPAEAAALIVALPERDRALWATAFYAGLRSGELQALRFEDVDLQAGVIRVEQAYDPKAHTYVEPKSKAGKRTTPIPAALRKHLMEQKLRSGWTKGLVFGRGPQSPFTASNVWRRAHTAWGNAGLAPISLHEARHVYASLMIAAGVNAKSLQTYTWAIAR